MLILIEGEEENNQVLKNCFATFAAVTSWRGTIPTIFVKTSVIKSRCRKPSAVFTNYPSFTVQAYSSRAFSGHSVKVPLPGALCIIANHSLIVAICTQYGPVKVWLDYVVELSSTEMAG